VLFGEWDPVGVNDNPLCEDESDSCAPAVCRMLKGGADEVKLAAHLGRLRTDAMGLPDGGDRQEHDRRQEVREEHLSCGRTTPLISTGSRPTQPGRRRTR
jgi:hypothetical protein